MKNVGTKEKYVRIGLGLAAGLAALKMRKHKLIASALASAAASGLRSGLTQYCPMKAALGFEDIDVKQGKRAFPPAPVRADGAEAAAI